MAKEIEERLLRLVYELRREVAELSLEDSAIGGFISLERYCQLIGRRPKTVKNDLNCGDDLRVRRHPEFRQNQRGVWVTSLSALDEWWQRARSSYFGSPAVRRALRRRCR